MLINITLVVKTVMIVTLMMIVDDDDDNNEKAVSVSMGDIVKVKETHTDEKLQSNVEVCR